MCSQWQCSPCVPLLPTVATGTTPFHIARMSLSFTKPKPNVHSNFEISHVVVLVSLCQVHEYNISKKYKNYKADRGL